MFETSVCRIFLDLETQLIKQNQFYLFYLLYWVSTNVNKIAISESFNFSRLNFSQNSNVIFEVSSPKTFLPISMVWIILFGNTIYDCPLINSGELNSLDNKFNNECTDYVNWITEILKLREKSRWADCQLKF